MLTCVRSNADIFSNVCYNEAPPTGNANCDIWYKKCQSIQAACAANDFSTPSGYGKILTPSMTVNATLPAPSFVEGTNSSYVLPITASAAVMASTSIMSETTSSTSALPSARTCM